MINGNSEIHRLLKFIAAVGHGVFSSLLLSKKQAAYLRVWIQRHPEFVVSQTAKHLEPKIHILSPRGMHFFGSPLGPTGTNLPAILWDILLINSYLWEKDDRHLYSYQPHLQLDLNGERVGILSSKWGLPKQASRCDKILSLPSIWEEFKSCISASEIASRIYIPRCVQGVRR